MNPVARKTNAGTLFSFNVGSAFLKLSFQPSSKVTRQVFEAKGIFSCMCLRKSSGETIWKFRARYFICFAKVFVVTTIPFIEKHVRYSSSLNTLWYISTTAFLRKRIRAIACNKPVIYKKQATPYLAVFLSFKTQSLKSSQPRLDWSSRSPLYQNCCNLSIQFWNRNFPTPSPHLFDGLHLTILFPVT